MRHRIRTDYFPDDHHWSESASRVFEHPNGTTRVNSHGVTLGSSDFVNGRTVSDLWDIDTPKAKLVPLVTPHISPKSRDEWGREYVQQAFKPVHPCIHDKIKVESDKGLEIIYATNGSLGFEGEFLDTNVHYHASAGSFLAHDFLVSDVADAFAAATPRGSSGNYVHPDWFALQDSFDEALSSFVPSSFFLGEDIAERAIFIDAFKLVINPTNAIKVFLKTAVHQLKKHRTMSLGQVARSVTRNGANGWLSYNFAVKPAIKDLLEVVNAHQKVKRRMDFLVSHRGRFVPVRVKQECLASCAPSWPEPPDYNSYSSFFTNVVRKHTLATMGCWAQVREDLTYGESWKAYLQHFGANKVLGTAWELIPFSFVVDWFLPVQELINKTRLPIGNPFVEMRSFCCSLKETEELGLFCQPGLKYNAPATRLTSPSSYFHVATKTTSRYERFSTVPETSGVVDVSTLGLFHSLATGSLVIQRLSKR